MHSPIIINANLYFLYFLLFSNCAFEVRPRFPVKKNNLSVSGSNNWAQAISARAQCAIPKMVENRFGRFSPAAYFSTRPPDFFQPEMPSEKCFTFV